MLKLNKKQLKEYCQVDTIKLKGISLIEVVIAVAILAILIIAATFSFSKQLQKGYDAKRKSDLNKIKKAFTEYYNDNECYPPVDTLERYCNGDDIHILDDYLKPVPCDPQTKKAYLYRPYPNNSSTCGGFRVYANLTNTKDPAIAELNCNHDDGCGAGNGFESYNYGVSEAIPVSYHSSNDTPDLTQPSATPTPTQSEQTFAVCCESSGMCNSYSGGLCSQTVYYGTTEEEAYQNCLNNCAPAP